MSGGGQVGDEPKAADRSIGTGVGARSDGGAVRAQVLEAARAFIGTPYRHQGSRRGVGCDCLGLVRGVWREVYGAEPERPQAYTPDWAEHSHGEPLIEAAERHCRRIAIDEALPGDLVIFRWRDGATAKHCGILDDGAPEGGTGVSRDAVASGGRRVIHAYEGAAVVSSPLVPSWARRIAAAFRFPE